MSEDKKIRVSADLSEMRKMRDEILSLYREINASEEKSRQATEAAINQLRQQLSLMTDKVSLEKILSDLKRQQSQAPVYNDVENSLTWDVSGESTSTGRKPSSGGRKNTTASAISDLANIMRDTEKSVVSIRDFLVSNDKGRNAESLDKDVLKNIYSESRSFRLESNSKSRDREEVQLREDDETIDLGRNRIQIENNDKEVYDKIIGAIHSTRTTLSGFLEGIGSNTRALVDETKLINRYLDTIGASVSIIEDNSMGGGSETKPSGSGGSPGIRGGIAGGATVVALQELLKYGRQFIDLFGSRYLRNQRAEAQSLYQDPISNVGLAFRTAGANEADWYRWIPIVGKYISQSIETKYETQGEMAVTGLNALRQMQNQAVSLAQTLGVSNSRALGIASQEGSYAASALGMNIGEYSERRAQLIRASGGRITGAGESQALLAAERLFGLSPSATSALQGSMRFNVNERTSGSEVIAIFERTMKELKLPFEEIASTMEESLNTFNKTSENILSRAGETDAVRIAAILSGVRGVTGARGRQLERYQEAFTGQNLGRDEISQAFLQRAFFRANPNAQLSDFKVMQDDWTKGNGIDILFSTLEDIQKATGYNKQSTFSALEKFLPGLSATDIDKLFGEGNKIDFEAFKEAITKNAEKLSENELTYTKRAAESTVGIEGMFKAYDNQMKAIGEKSVGLLEKIFAEVQDMNMKLKPGEEYYDNLREKTRGMSIFNPSDKNTPWQNQYLEASGRIRQERSSGKITEEQEKELLDKIWLSAAYMKMQARPMESNMSSIAKVGLMQAGISSEYENKKIQEFENNSNALLQTAFPGVTDFNSFSQTLKESANIFKESVQKLQRTTITLERD